MKKKKNKKRTFLNEEEKKSFAQHLINGRMIKQVVAEYNVSIPYGYQIFRELLEWKMEWKHKETDYIYRDLKEDA